MNILNSVLLKNFIRREIKKLEASEGPLSRLGIYKIYSHPWVQLRISKISQSWKIDPSRLIPVFQTYDFHQICALQEDIGKLSEVLSLSRNEAAKYAAFMKKMGFRSFSHSGLADNFVFRVATKQHPILASVEIYKDGNQLVVSVLKDYFGGSNFEIRLPRTLVLLRHYRSGLEKALLRVKHERNLDSIYIDFSDAGLKFTPEERGQGNLFAFTRRREYPEIGLVPDPYTLSDLDDLGRDEPEIRIESARQEYALRKQFVFWRGATTGLPTSDNLMENKRIQFCVRSLAFSNSVDAKISRVIQLSDPIAGWSELVKMGVADSAVQEGDFGKYQAYIDLDGNSSAWGTFRKYLQIVHVIRFKTEFEMFYHVNQPSNTFTELADAHEFFACIENDPHFATNFNTAWNGYLYALDIRRRIQMGEATVFPFEISGPRV